MNSNYFIVVGLFLLCLSVSSAQEKMRGSISFFAWDQHVVNKEPYVWMSGKVTQVTDLHMHQRTKPYPYQEKLPLQLAFKRAALPHERITIPIEESWKKTLIILMTSAEDPNKTRAVAIDDSDNAYTYGEYKFINVTGRNLKLTFDGSFKIIKKGNQPVILKPKITRKKMIPVSFTGPDQKILYSSIWSHDPKKQKTIFIRKTIDSRTGIIDFKILTSIKTDQTQP